MRRSNRRASATRRCRVALRAGDHAAFRARLQAADVVHVESEQVAETMHERFGTGQTAEHDEALLAAGKDGDRGSGKINNLHYPAGGSRSLLLQHRRDPITALGLGRLSGREQIAASLVFELHRCPVGAGRDRDTAPRKVERPIRHRQVETGSCAQRLDLRGRRDQPNGQRQHHARGRERDLETLAHTRGPALRSDLLADDYLRRRRSLVR